MEPNGLIFQDWLQRSEVLLATLLCEGSDTESGHGSPSGYLGRHKMPLASPLYTHLLAFTSAIFFLKSRLY